MPGPRLSLINMVKARLREIAPLSQMAGFAQPNPHLLSRGTFLLKTSTTSTDNDVFYFKKKILHIFLLQVRMAFPRQRLPEQALNSELKKHI